MKKKFVVRLLSLVLATTMTLSQGMTSYAADMPENEAASLVSSEESSDEASKEASEDVLIFDEEDVDPENVEGDDEIEEDGETESSSDASSLASSEDEAADEGSLASSEDEAADESSLEASIETEELELVGNGAFDGVSGTISSGISYTLDDEGVLTITGNGILPAYLVKNSNLDKDMITEVVFSGKITQIGNHAFDECRNLEKITLPESLSIIESYAFATTNITEVVIPSSVTNIGGYAFYNCSSLKTVKIQGNKITTAGNYIFNQCAISTVEFPNGMTSIPSKLFNGAWFNDCTITIPSTVTTIGEYAFASINQKGHGISKLIFEPGSQLKTIGNYAFDSSMIEAVEIPAGVTGIGNYAFATTNLEEVVIPSNVTNIGGYAFYNCSSLKTVKIQSKKITTAGNYIFNQCAISTVEFPNGMTSIPSNLFNGAWFNDCTITIPGTVTTIGKYAFASINQKGHGISKLIFEPDSQLKTIGNYAFDSSMIETVEIPAGVTEIGSYAFATTNLEEVVIPSSVTNIGSYAFYNCSILKTVKIQSKKITTAGNYIFNQCAISTVEFPNGMTSIPSNLFNGAWFNDCTITIPGTVTTIGGYAFASINQKGHGISKLIFEPDSQLKTIGKYAFDSSMIETVEIPAGVTEIGNYAFATTNLEEIVIPSKVTKIGSYAFYNCPLLQKVTIPSSVKTIEASAFSTTDNKTIKVYVPKNTYAYKWVSDNAKRYNYQIVSVAGIKYVLNGGTNDAANPVTYETGETVVLEPATRVGYTFEAWYYDAKFTKPVDGVLNTDKGADLTVYAKWTANKYDVTYDVNGGNALENDIISQLTYGGAYPKTLAVPTRTGYTFAGWYTEKTGGSKITGGTTKFTSADPGRATIYARWTPYAYTIRFNSNPPEGKNATKTQKATYDANVTLTANTFKATGGSFTGWNTEKDGTGTAYTDKEVVTENLVDGSKNNAVVDLYAQWNTVDYVVFLDTGVKAGEASDGSLQIGGTSLPETTPEDFKAATGIDVSAVSGNGYLQAMKYGEEFELSGDEFGRKGYIITGWKNSKTGKVIKNSAIKNLTTKGEVVTLTAQWTKAKYSVAYNLNGGAYAKGAAKGVATYSIDNVETALPDGSKLTRVGYSFAGWYDNAACEGTPITFVGVSKTDEEKDILRNLTLFAKWNEGGHTLTFDLNGGACGPWINEEDLTVSMSYTDVYVIRTYFATRDGYTLSSWNTQADGKGKKYAATATISKLTDDLTLYAIWTPEKYAIKYDLDGGKQTGAPVSYTTDKETILKTPVKTGFFFEGWDADGLVEVAEREVNGKKEYYLPANVGNVGDAPLLAKWRASEYRIRLHYDGTDSVESVIIEKDYSCGQKYEVNELVAEAKKAGWDETHKISAFTTKAGGRGTKYAVSSAFSNLIIQDGAVVELYAVYGAKNNYTISYNLNGGTLANPVYSYDGTRDVAIADPVMTGYVFKGWILETTDESVEFVTGEHIIKWGCTPFTMDRASGVIKKLKIGKGSNMNVVLTATYEPSKHAVTIETLANDARFADDFTDANGKTYNAGDAVPAKFSIGSYAYEVEKELPVLVRDGYTFSNYTYTKNDWGDRTPTDAGILTTASKVTIYPVWLPNVYSVSYLNVDDSVANPNPDSITSGKSYTLKNLSKKGYTFVGWKLADVDSAVVHEEIVPVNTAFVKVIKNNKGMVTQIPVGNAGNIALEPVFTENQYTLKISSNGAKSTNARLNPATFTLGTKNYSQEVTDELVEKAGLFAGNDGETAVYTKKGFVFAGFATDAKGKNIVLDENGLVTGTYAGGEIFGLSDKNKATASLYAVWEKVVADKPAISNVTLNGAKDEATVVFDVPYTAAEVSYEVQCSSSIIFRNSVTVREVFDNVSGNTVTIDTATTNGTNHFRIRQIKTDSQGNVVTGKWSKRFAVK